MATYESIFENAVGGAVALIQHLNKDELQQLLNDDSKLDDLVKDLPQVKSLVTEKEMLLAQNKSLAEYNLGQEPKLRQAKEKLLHTYEEAAKHKELATAKKIQLDSVSDSRSIDTTLALLQTAACEADEESETINKRFLNGETNVDQFLEEFLSKRKLAHLRRIKAEKMRDLIQNGLGQSGSASANYSTATHPAMNYWSSGYSTYRY